MFLMRAVDCLVRLIPTMNGVLSWEKKHDHVPGLAGRMMTFAWQSVASMIVALVVWERSEFFLLKNLCSDIRQVAYYSVAFSMAERLLISATIFGSAAGATIFAQYGRDKSRLPDITASSFRYLVLTSIPLHFLSAALAVPALLLLYGNQYKGAAMIVILAPLLCLPKAFISPVQSLFQSNERQSHVIVATVIAGIVDIAVAWYLIPAHGAVGACLGSGAGQVLAVGILWAVAIRLYKVRLPWLQASKTVCASVLAALAAYFIAVRLAPLWGILWGGSSGLAALFASFYIMRVLEPEDRSRFETLIGMTPKSVATPLSAILSWLIRPALTLRGSAVIINDEGI